MDVAIDVIDADYADMRYQRVLRYVRNLLTFKERFVSAFIDNDPNLGQRG